MEKKPLWNVLWGFLCYVIIATDKMRWWPSVSICQTEGRSIDRSTSLNVTIMLSPEVESSAASLLVLGLPWQQLGRGTHMTAGRKDMGIWLPG